MRKQSSDENFLNFLEKFPLTNKKSVDTVSKTMRFLLETQKENRNCCFDLESNSDWSL